MHHDRPDWDQGPRGPFDHRGPDHPRDGGCRCGPDCHCGCHGPGGPRDEGPHFDFERHFVSKAELLEALEWYLSELLNEAQGVREAIADLKEEMAEDQAAAEPAPRPAAAKAPRRGRPRKTAEAPAQTRRRGRPQKTPAAPAEPEGPQET